MCGAYAGVNMQELQKARPGILVEVSSLNLEFSVLALASASPALGLKLCAPHLTQSGLTKTLAQGHFGRSGTELYPKSSIAKQCK